MTSVCKYYGRSKFWSNREKFIVTETHGNDDVPYWHDSDDMVVLMWHADMVVMMWQCSHGTDDVAMLIWQ
jgi:hypothetical protein